MESRQPYLRFASRSNGSAGSTAFILWRRGWNRDLASDFRMCNYYAGRVEKQKKTHDIQTYKEIMAFTEGKKLDEIEKYRESGKRPYQKLLLAVCAGLLTLAVSAVMIFLLR